MSRETDPQPIVTALAPDDWQLLRELRLAALGDTPEVFWATREDEAGYDEDRWRRWLATSHWFVARLEGRPVGLCALLAREQAAAPELVSMWVAPDARRRGVASVLLRRACDDAAGTGAAALDLWVVEGNDAALDLYRRSGFEPTGDREPMPRGESHEIRLRRRLRPADAAGAAG